MTSNHHFCLSNKTLKLIYYEGRKYVSEHVKGNRSPVIRDPFFDVFITMT